jgi:hypothetical protein
MCSLLKLKKKGTNGNAVPANPSPTSHPLRLTCDTNLKYGN